MLALTKAFEARNERIRNDEKGFTLIELLVVVIIIGILAAIAIPVFLGQQDKAKDSAVKSDLASAKVFFVSNLVDDPTGATGILGYAGTNVTVKAGSTASAFCLSAPSKSTGTPTFSVNQSGGVVKAAC